MKALRPPIFLGWLLALGWLAVPTHAELVISEILFNPPGSDAPNQYIELRGAPNLVVPAGTWLVAVAGATADPAQYPLPTIISSAKVHVMETETLLLNELKVNPPGANDAPWEFVEIKGPPDALLTNVYFLAIESRASKTPGRAELVVDLTSARLGDSGLLVISATNDPYHIPRDATLWSDPRFNQPGSTLGNGATSFLLVTSPKPIEEGTDLDAGNNGKLEGLPNGTTVLDSVAFGEGDRSDVFYTSAVLTLAQGAPDAASRWPTNNTPRSAAAWFYGALSGATSESLVFDSDNLSTNFPAGVVLTPGAANDISLTVAGVEALSGVIADATNPGLSFTVADANSANAAGLLVTASSSDLTVIPDSNLSIVAGPGGLRTLYLYPVGVGYSTITITVSNSAKVGQIGFPYAASAMGRPGGIFHTGTADGSAAVALDADLMFVGDNENQVIRLYDRQRSGPPVAAFDFQPFLDVGAQEHGEVNIEGSTRVGNRLFWIGAHSNSNLGEGRTNRARIFATDIVGAGPNARLVFVGYYEHLKTDLVNWDSANGHGQGTNYYGLAASAADNVNPKAPDGFNIEGLSMAPGSTNAAYIGLRAPIVPPTNRTCALIVPVLNFADLASKGGPPGSAVFGPPIELDLYGRGIRSIEGTADGYLICAGPTGDSKSGYPNDFKLYTWTGNPADPPRQRSADLSGMQPEGIAELPPLPWTSDTLVQLITDSGTTVPYDDGIQDKHLPIPAFRKFRSDWVALGAVVKPAPVILAIQRDGIDVTLTWRALKGESYQVQTTIDLGQAAWQDLPGDVKATGPYASEVASRNPDRQRFYRVVVAP